MKKVSVSMKRRYYKERLSVGDKVSFTGVNGETLTDVITRIDSNVIEGKLYDLSIVKLTKVK